MKIKQATLLVIVMVLLLGVISVDAAPLSSLVANLPWTTAVIDEESNPGLGQYVSIAHHPRNGSAYLSYYDAKNGDLIMAHKVAQGTGDCLNADWDCEIVDSSGDVGKFSSIDVTWVVPPLPGRGYTKVGISYYDETYDALKYAEYRSGAGWTIQEVDDHPSAIPGDGSRGTHSALKFNSSHDPTIAYHTVGNLLSIGGVKIASYNASGTGTGCSGNNYGNWNCESIDTMSGQTDYGTYISLDFDYGDDIDVAFYDSFNSQLIWASYWGFGGSCSNDAWDCVTVDGAGDVGKFVSLHGPDSISDRMQLAYFDATTTGKVKYAVQVNSGGNCTSGAFDCFDVDTIGNPIGSIGLSITVDQQEQPIITYMDASNEFTASWLNIARPASAYGNNVGNCGEVPPGYLFMYWQCETVDKGYQDLVDEAAYAAVSVGPSGLATIAYYEFDSYYLEGRVKVAQQHFMTYLPVILK